MTVEKIVTENSFSVFLWLLLFVLETEMDKRGCCGTIHIFMNH